MSYNTLHAAPTSLSDGLSSGEMNEFIDSPLILQVAHTASPWHFKGESWASYRDPAVKGTTNVLQQAAKVDSESFAHRQPHC